MIEDETVRVLVTAGAAGIGLGIADAFLRTGAQVCVGDIDAAAVAAALQSRPRLQGVRADISIPAEVAYLVATATDRLGGIDVLVNNAGIAGPSGPLQSVNYEDWARTFAVNVHGAFLALQHVVPQMIERGAGCIVNISTSSVRTGLPGRSAYVASKAALEGLTLNAARELGPHNIRVNAVRPGFMDSARMRTIIERQARERGMTTEAVERDLLRYISLRTKIGVDEIGDMCVYLASRAARHVSGQVIAVDGNAEWEG